MKTTKLSLIKQRIESGDIPTCLRTNVMPKGERLYTIEIDMPENRRGKIKVWDYDLNETISRYKNKNPIILK